MVVGVVKEEGLLHFGDWGFASGTRFAFSVGELAPTRITDELVLLFGRHHLSTVPAANQTREGELKMGLRTWIAIPTEKACPVVFWKQLKIEDKQSGETERIPLLRFYHVFIVVIHNHPSGDPTPSEADIKVTRDLIRAGQLLKIEVCDHVIVGQPGHSSLRALGYFYS